jgi:RHS repeat-associated protein
MPNRHGADVSVSDDYDYGFNGKLKDNEVKGNGNSYDYGARMLDPRIGRWFSPDALEYQYPGFSPYNFVKNNPVTSVDPDGNWVEEHTNKYYKGKDGKPVLKTTFWHKFKKTVKIETVITVHNAKVYFDSKNTKNSSAEKKKEIAKRISANIEYVWDQKYGEEGDEDDKVYYKGPELSLKIEFAEDIQVIDNLNDVNSTGNKTDELFIVADQEILENWGIGTKGAEGLNMGQMTLLTEYALDPNGKLSNAAGHEYGHRLGHPDNPSWGSVMEQGLNSATPSPEEITRISTENKGFKPDLKKYQKKRKKLDKKQEKK